MDRLISLQAAIDALEGEQSHVERPITETRWFDLGLRRAQGVLSGLPSAQPEPQWIPCSETVDIPDHKVLCCDKYEEELIGWVSYSDDQWLCESEGEMMYDPIAWRELPKPWEGETDG